MATSTQEKLLVLQERDRKIAKIEKELQDIPARKKMIQSRLNEHKAALEAVQEDLKKKQAKLKTVEGDIEAIKLQGRKFKDQQALVKTNQEYKALESEFGKLDGKISDKEDQQLSVMDEIDAVKVLVREKETELKEEEATVKADIEKLDKRVSAVTEEVNELKKQRKELAADISKDWLSRYERIYKHTKDFGLVAIENGICGGCHMKVTPQTVHNARRGTEMTVCEFCQRLLYSKS